MIKDQADYTELSFLIIENGIVVETGGAFHVMTGYLKHEIVMKTTTEIFTKYLKLSQDISSLDFNHEGINCYLFTKNLRVRDVFVRAEKLTAYKSIVYFIEKSKTKLEDRLIYFDQLCADNLAYIALYSVPDLILFNASQKYINFFHKPYNIKNVALGLRLSEFTPDFIDPSSQIYWNDLITKGISFKCSKQKYINKMRDETYWDYSVVPIFEDGKVKYCIVTATEITSAVKYRKQVQDQSRILLHQHEQLEAIIENMSDALFIVDKDGHYVMLNIEARKYIYPNSFENTREFYEAYKCLDTEDNEICFENMPTSRVLRGEKVEQEFIKISDEYKELILSVSGVPVYNSSSSFLFGVMCCRDVTELYKSNKLKDEFLTVISHEFRTPLTIINSAIQMLDLLYKGGLPEKVIRYLHIIRQNAFRQMRLINNLLDVTKISADRLNIHKKNFDIVFLTKAMIKSVQLYSHQKGINLTFTSRIKRKIIGIDEEKYERIMLNLLSNAIKFTPENKSIKVTLTTMKGFVKIDVKDEGIGIPKDKQQLIFERFGQVDSSLTRMAEGTGIGLSLVKMLVFALGGKISVKSEVNNGSTFTLLLPEKKASEACTEECILEQVNHRLVQAINIEFSDIYFQ